MSIIIWLKWSILQLSFNICAWITIDYKKNNQINAVGTYGKGANNDEIL